MERIYLDSAATTRPYSDVVDEMILYYTTYWENPSSLYKYANDAKLKIQSAKEIVAQSINAEQEEIYFTSCGSESNCMAIEGFALNRLMKGESSYIITTNIEHHSIEECARAMNLLPGCNVVFIDVDKKCFVNTSSLIDALEDAIKVTDRNNILVSIQLANNEVGTIQDIKTISAITHEYGATLHVDAVQAFCHIPIDVEHMGIDMLSASAHKIGAAKGTGFLYKSDNIEIQPIIYGSQMRNLRGGTEDVAGIVGMAKAVELSKDNQKNKGTISLVRDYFIDKLESIGCTLNGSKIDRLPNNINVMLPEGIGGEEMLYCLDTSGIMISTGSACNSMSKKPSRVLKAMSLTDEEAARSIRISISPDITMEQIDYVVNEIEKAIKILSL